MSRRMVSRKKGIEAVASSFLCSRGSGGRRETFQGTGVGIGEQTGEVVGGWNGPQRRRTEFQFHEARAGRTGEPWKRDARKAVRWDAKGFLVYSRDPPSTCECGLDLSKPPAYVRTLLAGHRSKGGNATKMW